MDTLLLEAADGRTTIQIAIVESSKSYSARHPSPGYDRDRSHPSASSNLAHQDMHKLIDNKCFLLIECFGNAIWAA